MRIRIRICSCAGARGCACGICRVPESKQHRSWEQTRAPPPPHSVAAGSVAGKGLSPAEIKALPVEAFGATSAAAPTNHAVTAASSAQAAGAAPMNPTAPRAAASVSHCAGGAECPICITDLEPG